MKKTNRMVLAALLCALSIVLARLATINLGFVHLGFGNLPVVLAGVVMGPGLGFAVGAVADLIGGILAGYAINPMITLGAGLIGGVAGWGWQKAAALPQTLRLAAAILPAHILGSVVVNSLALRWFYGYPWAALATRVPNMLVQAVVEILVLRVLLRSSAFRRAAGL